MNLPNRLTVVRIALIPVMVILLSFQSAPYSQIGGAVFFIAALTDYFDGHIARKRHLITDFGRFLDPLADKLLVLSALILLTASHQVPAWLTVLILARELSIDGLRMIAVNNGTVISAGKLGKIKTASQMVYILFLLFLDMTAYSNWFTIVLTVWIALITVASGADYFRQYGKELVKEGI